MIKLCRLCLRVSRDNHQLFVTCIGEKLIIELIWTTFGVQIDECDNLPANICERCLKKVKHLNSFHEEVITSQTQLNHWKESGTLDASLKRLLSTEASRQPSDDILEQLDEATNDSITRGIVQQPCTSVLVDEDENTLVEKAAIDEDIQSNSCTQDDALDANDEQQSLSAEEHTNDTDYQESCATMETFDDNYSSSEHDSSVYSEIRRADLKVAEVERWPAKRLNALVSYKCHICNVVCESKVLFDVHLINHKDMLPYECSTCSTASHPIILKTAMSLSKHLESHGFDRKCPHCPLRFRTQSSYHSHVRTIHAKIEGGTKCKICGKELPDLRKYLIHMRAHRNLKSERYKCTICQTAFSTLQCLENHQLTHGQPIYVCPFCSKSFGRKYSLDNHKMCHVRQQSNGEYAYYCSICNIYFPKEEDLLKHKPHEPTPEYPRYIDTMKYLPEALKFAIYPRSCEEHECTFVADTILQMWSHYKHQHNRKGAKQRALFKCDICRATFAYTALLYRHMDREHSNSKTTSDTITNHQQKTPEESHEAPPDEPKTYASEKNGEKSDENNIRDGDLTPEVISGLSADMNGFIKYGEKTDIDRKHEVTPLRIIKKYVFPKSLQNANSYPRSCLETGCDFVAKSYRAMVAHYQRHFKMYKCQQCGKRFPTAATLNDHIGLKHVKTKKNACKICGKCFSTKKNLKEHIALHLAVKPYKCQFCDKSFNCLNDRRWHINRFHNQRLKNSIVEALSAANSAKNNANHETAAESDIANNDTTGEQTLDVEEELIAEELADSSIDLPLASACEKTGENNETNLSATDIHDEIQALCITREYHFPIHLRGSKTYPRPCEESGCKYLAKSVKLMRFHHQYHYKAFQCRKCEKKYPTKGVLMNHIEVQHLNTRKFECKICHKSYKNKYNFVMHKHKEESEIDKNVLECSICQAAFDDTALLFRHMEQEHPTGNADNSTDDEREEKLEESGEASTDNPEAYTSEEDDEKSDDSNDNPEDKIRDGDLTPEVISTLSADVNGFVKYVGKNEIDGGHKVKPIGIIKKYVFPISLQNAESYPRGCQETGCDFVAKTYRTMVAHYQRHFKMYKCQQCEKRFPTAATLKVHIELRHKCKICGKHFSKWKKLRDHMLTHETYKRYKCHFCDKLFNSSSARRWHMNKFHKQKLEKLLEADLVKNDAKQEVAAESDIEKSVASNDIADENILCDETSRDIEEEKNYIKEEALDIEEELIAEELPEDSMDPLLAGVCDKTVENNETNLSSTDLQNEIQSMFIALKYNFPVHLRASKTYPRPCEESGCTYVARTVKLMRFHHQHHSKAFQCRECLRRFPHKGLLINHIEVEHLNTRKFECKICNKTYKSKYNFDIHKHKETREIDSLQRSICQVTSAGAALLYTHIDQEHSTGNSTTDTITHELQPTDSKESDEAPAGTPETCSPGENNEISEDNNSNLSTNSFQVNIGDEDGNSTSEILSRLSADVNGIVWSNSKNAIDREFHAKPVRCIYKLIFPESLQNEKSYPRSCLETGCDFKSKTYRTMLAHYQRHYKMYKCQQCERKFAAAPMLKDHIEFKHMKKKNNTCNICGKYFSDKSQLTEHVLIHQIVKPHKCQLCIKSFNFRSGLSWHMIKHHKKTQRKVKKEVNSEADSFTNDENDTIAAESDTENPETTNNAFSDEHILCNDTAKNIKLEAINTDENLIVEEPPPGDATDALSSNVSENAIEKNKFNIFAIEEVENMCIVFKYHFPVNLRGGKNYPRPCEEPGCKYVARTVKLMRIHHQNHYKAFQCRECQKKYPTKGLLRNHIEGEHLKTRSFERCQFCGKTFNFLSGWRWHMNRFHELELQNLQIDAFSEANTTKNNANCAISADSDTRANNDNDDTARDIKQEVLDIEEELIAEESPEISLSGTLTSDVGEKTLENNESNTSAADTQNETHDRENDIQAMFIALTYHFPVHLRGSKTYPRPCEESGCKYIARSVKLMRVHHQNHYKAFQCRKCLRRFPHKGLLRNHIEADHLKTRLFECDICQKTYKQKYSFDMHKLKHQEIGTRKCVFCDVSCMSDELLKAHILKFHASVGSSTMTLSGSLEEKALKVESDD